jgi:hypothetical protein
VSSTLRALLAVSSLAVVAACTARAPAVNEAVPPPWLQDVPVAPLEIVEYRVAQAEGDRALFLRVSRFPDKLTYQPLEQPPELVLRLDGPAVGEDVPEERVVLNDGLMTALRVSRAAGILTVVVEFAAPELPNFKITEAADWITVRVAPQPE